MYPNPYANVLVLNFDYTPANIVCGKRAIVLLLKDRACMVSARVIRLKRYIFLPLSRASKEKPTKAAIYRRDWYCCQYCGSTRNLTIDHLIPKSRGGEDTWSNPLLACESCNLKKGDRLLNHTNMTLRRNPRPPLPKVVETVQQSTDPEWSLYRFG